MLDSDAIPSVVAIPNPGAGNNATFPVPGSERGVLVACSFRLTTSAVVATRTPVLEITDGSAVVIVGAAAGYGTPAGTTAQYTYATGLSEWDAATPAAGTQYASGPVPAIPLGVGDTITLRVTAIDAGDTLTNIRLSVLYLPVRDDAATH